MTVTYIVHFNLPTIKILFLISYYSVYVYVHIQIVYYYCLDYYSPALTRSDCMLQGIGQKLTTTVRVQHWQRKHFKLYSNRLEWADGYVVCAKM